MLIGPVASRMLQTVTVFAAGCADATATASASAPPAIASAPIHFQRRCAWTISVSFVFRVVGGSRADALRCDLLSCAPLVVEPAELAAPDLPGARQRQLVDELDVTWVLVRREPRAHELLDLLR